MAMADVDEFLASVLPRLKAADTAIHDGDAGPRIALWSRNDPVTLFGALQHKTGWLEIAPVFEMLASRFSNCESFEYEVLAAGVSGDLAYIAGIEHTTAAVGDAPAQPYELRVTTVFRQEDSEWRVVHRHADPVPRQRADARAAGPPERGATRLKRTSRAWPRPRQRLSSDPGEAAR
jgi:ketosteroid isomerase-like protein